MLGQTFSGKVVDEGKEPIAFANAVLLSLPDSTFITGVATDEVGKFVLEAKNQASIYLLKITALGYTPFSQSFDKGSGDKLEEIVLKTAVVEVEEVSVVATRPKIRMERGVYIADIENSLVAIGNTVETLLNQLPGGGMGESQWHRGQR